jgi:hypothetical protein
MRSEPQIHSRLKETLYISCRQVVNEPILMDLRLSGHPGISGSPLGVQLDILDVIDC